MVKLLFFTINNQISLINIKYCQPANSGCIVFHPFVRLLGRASILAGLQSTNNHKLIIATCSYCIIVKRLLWKYNWRSLTTPIFGSLTQKKGIKKESTFNVPPFLVFVI